MTTPQQFLGQRMIQMMILFNIYDEHRRSKETPLTHAAVMNSRTPGIPVAFPHDGLQHDKGSGIQLAQQYRDLGVYMLPDHFSNPPTGG